MRYRLSEKAAQDVTDVYVYGARQFGTAQAERYYQRIERLLHFLADNPLLARERLEFSPPVRIHPIEAHIIVYVLDDEGLLVLRILGGRQNWEQYL